MYVSVPRWRRASGETVIGRLWERRFVRFLAAGGTAALVNVASRIWFNRWLDFAWSVVAAYLCGMLVAWTLSRMFVFERSPGHWSRELARFSLVNLLAAAQVWGISVGLERFALPALGLAFHPRTVAHVIGVSAPVITSYVAHLRFSFRPA